MPDETPTTIDEYLDAQPEAVRALLARVRSILQKALPGAVEGISYRIPVYRQDGAVVTYFSGFREHFSLYPATPGLIDELGDAIADRLHGRGTIRFSYDEPVPSRLIARIAKIRAREAADKRRAKARPRAKVTPTTRKRQSAP